MSTTPTLSTLSAPQALSAVRERLDGPDAVLVADLIETHLAKVKPGSNFDRLDAVCVFGALQAAADLLRARCTNHKASPFALDRVGNMAQICQGQWEAWEAYRKEVGEDWSYAEHQSWAEAHGRLTALTTLLGILRRGDAGPLKGFDEDDYPPDSKQHRRTPDILDISKRHTEDRLQAEFLAQGAESREQVRA